MKTALSCRVARTTDELEKAYSLVYREYLKKGYTEEDPSGLRFSVYSTLPHATTFIAITDAEEVIATATVVPDSVLELPMDEVYHRELNQLRQQGKKFCEISMLASETKNVSFILAFFKVLLDYVTVALGLDYMCIAINPRYAMAFSIILFKDLGGLKRYPAVNGAPAVAKYLDVHSVAEGFSRFGRKKLYEIFVAATTHPDNFCNKKILSSEEVEYFLAKTQTVSLDKQSV